MTTKLGGNPLDRLRGAYWNIHAGARRGGDSEGMDYAMPRTATKLVQQVVKADRMA